MSIFEILTFVTFATLLVMSPGPNGVLIAKTVTTGNLKRANSNIIGFVSAFYLHGSLSILGISAILMRSAEAFIVFKTIGAIYLCYLGLKSLNSVFKIQSPQATKGNINENVADCKVSVIRDIAEGFLTNALNPKVSLFYLAAFPQFIGTNESVLIWSYVLVSLHALINIFWFRALAFVINKSKSVAIKPSFKKALDAITGFVFIGFAFKLFTSKNAV